MTPKYFPAVFVRDLDKDGRETYSARVLDVPGAITWGYGLGEALAHARDALALALDGEEIPEPTPLDVAQDRLRDDPPDGVYFVQLVEFLPPEPVVRVNMTFPGDLLKRIDNVTGNRSAWLAEAAREKLASGAR